MSQIDMGNPWAPARLERRRERPRAARCRTVPANRIDRRTLLSQVRALQTEKHDFDSVVLDSLDWVEPLIWKAVCEEGKVETIEQYAGGYGKGYIRALDLWRTLLKELSALNEKMHVLLIGHAKIKSFQDPELPTAYDRYQLKIND